MAKIRKKTPKNSKRYKKTKDNQERFIVIGIFLVFVAVVGYLFYLVNIRFSDEIVVAVVNGEQITRDDLDWWYKVTVMPQFRDFFSKHDFLTLSLIPQEVLLQKAKGEKIKVSEDDVESSIGLFIIEEGLTLDEFQTHLESRGLTLDELKKSFETRVIINKLLEKENIYFSTEDQQAFFEQDDFAIQEYMGNLMNDSKIEIFSENIEKLILRSFEETGDELCSEDKPIIRLYTTSHCEICNETGNAFKNLVSDLDANITAFHWNLDTGDDLLTLKKEKGVPESEVELFKKYSPDQLVPTTVLGCKYKRVGSISGQEDEFRAILKTLGN